MLWHTDNAIFKSEINSTDKSKESPEIRQDQFIKMLESAELYPWEKSEAGSQLY